MIFLSDLEIQTNLAFQNGEMLAKTSDSFEEAVTVLIVGTTNAFRSEIEGEKQFSLDAIQRVVVAMMLEIIERFDLKDFDAFSKLTIAAIRHAAATPNDRASQIFSEVATEIIGNNWPRR